MTGFTFPEGVISSVHDQVIALNEGCNGDAIVLQFINEILFKKSDIQDIASQLK